MERWHILRTKLNRERQVAVQLHQRGVEVYLPLVWVNPVNPRAARQRPFFPGHIFARFDDDALNSDLIRCAPGLRGPVSLSGTPVTVSDEFIDELQQRLEQIRAVSGLGLEGASRAALLKIATGPFAGYEGVFNPYLDAADRTQILLACAQNDLWRQPTRSRSTTVHPKHER